MSVVVDERSPLKAPDPTLLPGLTPNELDTLKKVFSSPLDIPAEWRAWLVSYLEANPPQIPIDQIQGFSAFTASYAQQPLSNAITVANAWQTLANVGPHLDLPKGQYVLLYGCNYDASFGASGFMGYRLNGAATPSGYLSISPTSVQRFLLTRADIVTLPIDTGNNTIDFSYQASQTGPSFSNRWAIALKYANV